MAVSYTHLAFITSQGVLNSTKTSVRNELFSKADLVSAIRLPNNLFESQLEPAASVNFHRFCPHLLDIGSGSGFVLQNVNLGLLRVHHDGDKAAVAGTVEGQEVKGIGSAAKHALTGAVCWVGFICLLYTSRCV